MTYSIKDNIIFILCAAGLLIFRIWLGRAAGIFFSAFEYCDDALMINYADFDDHFIFHTMPYYDALVKDMGFPAFLALVNYSGLNYIDCVTFLWFICAITTVFLVKFLTGINNRKIYLAVYAYVLFMPVAFTYIGLRLYRNAVLTQFYFVVLEMMTILFISFWRQKKFSLKQLIFFNLIFGVIFTFTFYIKEDGFWLFICLCSVLLLCLADVIFFDTAKLRLKLFKTAALFLPLIIFFAGTNFYKNLNYYYFGVYLINNRTEGELGKFVRLVYKISSEERTGKIWAPADAIVKAFDASKTLKENSVLKDSIFHTMWLGGDIVKNPIHGDFLGWVMLSELHNSGTCHSLFEQEEYLKKVNAELESAFANGTLQKDNKIQITSSMGGRSLEEIFNLIKLTGTIYLSHITTKSYDFFPAVYEYVLYSYDAEENVNPQLREKYRAISDKASRITNIDFSVKNDFKDTSIVITSVLFKIYAVVNSILFVAALIGIIFAIKNFLNRQRKSLQEIIVTAVSAGALMLSFVYASAISWFAEFLHEGLLITYSSGVIPMLVIFETAGVYLLYISVTRDKKI